MKVYQRSNKAQTEKTQKSYEQEVLSYYLVRSNQYGYCFSSIEAMANPTGKTADHLQKRAPQTIRATNKKLREKGLIRDYYRKGTKDRIVIPYNHFDQEEEILSHLENREQYVCLCKDNVLINSSKSAKKSHKNSLFSSEVSSDLPQKKQATSPPSLHYIKKEGVLREEVVSSSQARELLPPFQTPTQKKQPSKCKDKFREQAIRDRKLEIDAIKDSSLGIHEKVCGEAMEDREFDQLAERFSYEEIAQKYKNALRTRAKIRACGNEDCGQYSLGLVGLTEYYILQAHREREAREARKSAQSGQEVDHSAIIDAIKPVRESAMWARQAVSIQGQNVYLTKLVCSYSGSITTFGGEDPISLGDPFLNEKIQTHLNTTAKYLQEVHKAGNYMADLAKMPKLSQTAAKSSHWRNRY